MPKQRLAVFCAGAEPPPSRVGEEDFSLYCHSAFALLLLSKMMYTGLRAVHIIGWGEYLWKV